jgi:diguanylate cyclase (GGDEF)-like protein
MRGGLVLSTTVLDIPTLFFVAVSVAALLGFLLIFAWLQERNTRALAWWGAAYLLGASSMALWSSPMLAVPLPPQLPPALIYIACGMIWNGVRLFHNRRVLIVPTFAGAVVWLTCCAIGLGDSETGRATIGALIVSVYTSSIAFELWNERRKSLFSRPAALVVPVLHGAMFLMPIAMRLTLPDRLASGWLQVLALETVFYAIGTAFIVLLMVKDHQVIVERTAANTDPLTGLLNRRGFTDHAGKLCVQQGRQMKPVTLMMLDLDHFKSINDRFGHAVGDEALRVFANSLRATLRAGDIVGRLGGEEFAVIIPADPAIAAKVAERVRAGFEKAGAVIAGRPMAATVSIGADTAIPLTLNIERMIERADKALYRAKSEGRNRVSMTGEVTVETTSEPTLLTPAIGMAPPMIGGRRKTDIAAVAAS